MKGFFIWLFIFATASVSAIIVNKYVLSNLHFTYPTIFQSWQMFVVSLVLILLRCCNQIEFQQFCSKNILMAWFPAVFFFAITIYSGSVALSNLPVPVFCLLQQTLSYGIVTISNVHTGKQKPTVYQTLLMMASMAAVLFVVQSDPTFSFKVYKWILVHCISFGCYSHYVSHGIENQTMKEVDIALLNAVSSVLLLLSFGYASGETTLVQEFLYIFHHRFHIACICSGVLAGVVIFSSGQLKQSVSVERVRFYNSMIMFMACIISPVFFDIALTVNVAFVILLGFISVNAFGYLSSARTPQIEGEVQRIEKAIAL